MVESNQSVGRTRRDRRVHVATGEGSVAKERVIWLEEVDCRWRNDR